MQSPYELIAALRSIESRSKGELLKEAADTMEAMLETLHYFMWTLNNGGEGCDVCAHRRATEGTIFFNPLSCALPKGCEPLWEMGAEIIDP